MKVEIDFTLKCILLAASNLKRLNLTWIHLYEWGSCKKIKAKKGGKQREKGGWNGMLKQFKSKEKSRVLFLAHHPLWQSRLWSLYIMLDSRFEPPREAPGFDFSCFVKLIMTQILDRVCRWSQKCQDESEIHTWSLTVLG